MKTPKCSAGSDINDSAGADSKEAVGAEMRLSEDVPTLQKVSVPLLSPGMI